jgi:formylglycine-generating enzyme required for sulfatase activity
MKMKIIAVAILSLVVVAEAKAQDQIVSRLRPFYKTFGANSKTKLKIVAGPEDVQLRNGRVAGKQWIATCGDYRFKLSIENVTGVKLEELVGRIEQLPPSYMKACVAVSDEGEDGIAIYASLGGARAHGGQGYINLVDHALRGPLGAMIIAHEAGHTLDQVARNTDPEMMDKWDAAIMADKMSISNYGDHSNGEDLAEFAQVYAICEGEGQEQLDMLKKLSPQRFELWQQMLAPAPGMPENKEITIDLGEGQKMEFVLIPAGEFMMGTHESPAEVVEALKLPKIFVEYLKNECPQHKVRIAKPFYFGKYEVTQDQWKAVMGTEPSYHKGEENLPVESVTWNEARQFIGKLNRLAKHPAIKFSLPTEAQWEYACRAGAKTRFHFGDDPKLLGEYAWYARNSGMKVHPIGLKKPNAWGLYDINGNVHEWCLDWHDSEYYKQSPEVNPTGPATGAARVTRGGSFYDGSVDYLRCSDRYHDHPDFHYYRYGIRVTGNPRH